MPLPSLKIYKTHNAAIPTHSISVVHLTLDGVNGKWRWRRNLCQIDGENSKLRRQSSEFSDGNAVIYDRYLRCHFWMTPYVHNTVCHWCWPIQEAGQPPRNQKGSAGVQLEMVALGWIWTVPPGAAVTSVGLARTIYIRCVYGIFGREITIYTVIHGVYIRFWPTLHISRLVFLVCWAALDIGQPATQTSCSKQLKHGPKQQTRSFV